MSTLSDTIALILIRFSAVLNNSSDWSNGVTIMKILSNPNKSLKDDSDVTDDLLTSSHI